MAPRFLTRTHSGSPRSPLNPATSPRDGQPPRDDAASALSPSSCGTPPSAKLKKPAPGSHKDKAKNRMSTAFRKLSYGSPTTDTVHTMTALSPGSGSPGTPPPSKVKSDRRRSSTGGSVAQQQPLPTFSLANLRRTSLPASHFSFRKGSASKDLSQMASPVSLESPKAVSGYGDAHKEVPMLPAISPVLEGLGIDVDESFKSKSTYTQPPPQPSAIPRSGSVDSQLDFRNRPPSPAFRERPRTGSGDASSRPSSVSSRNSRGGPGARTVPPDIPPISGARPTSTYNKRPISSVYSNVRPPANVEPPPALPVPNPSEVSHPAGAEQIRRFTSAPRNDIGEEEIDGPPPPVPSKSRDRQALLKKTLLNNSAAAAGLPVSYRHSHYDRSQSLPPSNRNSTVIAELAHSHSIDSSKRNTMISSSKRNTIVAASNRNTLVDVELRRQVAMKPLPSTADLYVLRPTQSMGTQTPDWSATTRPVIEWPNTPPLAYSGPPRLPSSPSPSGYVDSVPATLHSRRRNSPPPAALSRYQPSASNHYVPPSPSVYSVMSMAFEQPSHKRSVPNSHSAFNPVYSSRYAAGSQSSSIYDDGADEPPLTPLTPVTIITAERKETLSHAYHQPSPPASSSANLRTPGHAEAASEVESSEGHSAQSNDDSEQEDSSSLPPSPLMASISAAASNITLTASDPPPLPAWAPLVANVARPRSRIFSNTPASPPAPFRSYSSPVVSPPMTHAFPPANDVHERRTAVSDDEEDMVQAVARRPRRKSGFDAEEAKAIRAEKGRSFFLVSALNNPPEKRIRSAFYDSAAESMAGSDSDDGMSVF